jgi:hypothetical protein
MGVAISVEAGVAAARRREVATETLDGVPRMRSHEEEARVNTSMRLDMSLEQARGLLQRKSRQLGLNADHSRSHADRARPDKADAERQLSGWSLVRGFILVASASLLIGLTPLYSMLW